MNRIILFALATFVLASCNNNNYVKTKSGLLYKIASKGSGPQVKYGQMLKIQFTQKVGDSVIADSYETGLPVYAKVDSIGAVYNVLEVLPFVHKGDSVVVVEIGDSLKKKNLLPPYMKQGDKRTWTLKIADIFDTGEAVEKDKTAEMQKYQNGQSGAFDRYMAGKKDKLQKTNSGVYVDVQTPGSGIAADSGKLVSLNYTGKLVPSEKVFESNLNQPGAQPIEFVIGQGTVIPGLEDGLRLFHKGGKGTLYIPYQLAYNDRPGPGGLPYQNLIFEIEVLDIKDAPKSQPGMMMPPQSNRMDTTGGH